MSDSEPIILHPAAIAGNFGGGCTGLTSTLYSSKSLPTRFDRTELSQILNVYGRMVAVGEWRDYAIDMLKDKAVFSIFRRSSEFPLYRIEKAPRLARKQGAYSVITPTGQILKRGHELARVLRIFDKKLLKIVDS